jgi:hypothetical protein
MKQLNIAVLVIFAAAVLLTVLVASLLIRNIRLRLESGRDVSGNTRDSKSAKLFDRESRIARTHLSDEEIAKLRKQQENVIDKMANLSDEEREKFRAQMRDRFRVRQPGEKPRFHSLSPNEVAMLKERWGYSPPAKEHAPDVDAGNKLDVKWQSNQEGPANISVEKTEPNDQARRIETE